MRKLELTKKELIYLNYILTMGFYIDDKLVAAGFSAEYNKEVKLLKILNDKVYKSLYNIK